MAMAARYERGLFDPDAAAGESPFDHYIYVVASDGDMEEGVTSEASSLAGTQQLGNLIVIWDDNKISIEHNTDIALSEDVARYRAYGWHVQEVEGGENVVGIEDAIAAAKKVTDKPSFIALRTIIGYPAPTKMNTGGVHGSALGADEVAATKKVLGFDPDKSFDVSEDVITHTRALVGRGKEARDAWQQDFDRWAAREPERKQLLDRLLAQQLPDGWDADLPHWEPAPRRWPPERPPARCSRPSARCRAVGRVRRPRRSNNTTIKGANVWPAVDLDRGLERHLVRPDAALRHPRARHGLDPVRHRAARPTRAYGGTFLQFSDYMRPAVRLAALMDIDTIYVWTHDSIGLGEDGPTHQPIEHLAALRAIPRLSVVRPGDANETAYAWRTIIARGGLRSGSRRLESARGFILTRQGIPVLEGTDAEGVARGGYVPAAAT
jgi:transketolase